MKPIPRARQITPAQPRSAAVSLMIVAFLGLVGCTPAPVSQSISDPYEAQNRGTHKLNVAVDKNIIRPLANSANKIIPDEAVQGVVNFADNLELPGRVVNDVLQVRFDRAAENTVRFVINTTIGIGGLFDPAKAAGILGKETDFGETLYVWGLGEGNYWELPLLGPSTERDALGKIVDVALNPMRLVIPKNNPIGTMAKVGSKLADRGRYSDTVDSVLYESADSYAQARLLYLQHRRYNLGQAPADDQFEDPYAQ
jgi:phospholipid-binding lipoprotein MlaA